MGFEICVTHAGKCQSVNAVSLRRAVLTLYMTKLQVKNISGDLLEQLKEAAAEDRTTISEFVRVAIEHELARKRWQRTLSTRASTELHVTAAELLREECVQSKA